MQTKFTLLSAVLALAATASAACDNSKRFGQTTVTPSSGVKPGDVLTISTDFTCTAPASVNPISTDYILQGTTSTGAQAGEVFLARRNKTANVDTFTVKVPLYPKYSTTASFSVFAKVLHPITDSDGKQVLVTAGQLSPVSFA